MISSRHIKTTHGLVRQYYESGNNRKEEHYWRIQMTNIIFADTYGELEQLLSCPKNVLEVYLKNMQKVCHRHSGLQSHYFGCLHSIWQQHIQAGIWDGPPTTIKDLLKRVDYILGHTLIDEDPLEILKPLEYGEGGF